MKRLLWVVLFGMMVMSVSAQQKLDTLPKQVAHYQQKLEAFKKEPVVKGKVLFAGDDLTEEGAWRKLLTDSSVINRGINGDVTFGILHRMGEISAQHASKIFLMIGINDISKNIPYDVIMENIFSFAYKMKRGSKETQVFVQSILPTNKIFKNFPKGYDKNDQVILVNQLLQKYAIRQGFTYVNLYDEFSDAAGNLQTGYTKDGFHLNAIGYKHWVEVLKKQKYL